MLSVNKLCKCKKKASYVCLTHSIYLCEQERYQHNCNVMDIPSYSKNARINKINFVRQLKKLKQEKKANQQNLLNSNKEIVDSLKSINTKIINKLESLVSLFSKHNTDYIGKSLIEKIVEIEKQLNFWEGKNDYLSIGNFLKSKPFGKLRKTERDKVNKIRTDLTDNFLYKDISFLLLSFNKNLDICINSVKKKNDKEDKPDFVPISSGFMSNVKNFQANTNLRSKSSVKVKNRNKSAVISKTNKINNFFTAQKKNLKHLEIDNYLTIERKQELLTPLESTIIEKGKKSALNKIVSSGISHVTDSLKTFNFNFENQFKKQNGVCFVKSQYESETVAVNNKIDDDFDKQAIITSLKQMNLKVNDKAYFNMLNVSTVKQDVQDFLFVFRNSFDSLVRIWTHNN